SKSKGNVIDPLVIVKDYGADALRLTMAALTVQGRDIFLSTERIATYRLFLNKLWNASRFALMNLEDAEKGQKWDEKQLKLQDKWILSRLAEVTAEITKLLDGYFFGEAARLMYDFVWGELCDWYLELAKPALRGDEGEERRKSTQAVLLVLFEDVLKLLHPFIPFVTEELWHAFPFGDSYVMKNSWPKARLETLDEKAAADMKFIQEIIRTIRSLRAEARIAPSQQIPRVEITVHDDAKLALAKENERQILLLTRVETIVVSENKPEKSLASVLDDVQIYLPVGDLLDVEKEIQRLKADLAKLEKDIAKSSGKLANQNFMDRAPAEVIEKEKTELAENSAKKERMLENLKSLAE
ncbi:MAG: class I tRNA ligase family protein, partial [Synergistaceae bacterium]|nr:class I tRNA ligase family protein [Synergistaceae bacterium]